jgi:hypothetical protein
MLCIASTKSTPDVAWTSPKGKTIKPTASRLAIGEKRSDVYGLQRRNYSSQSTLGGAGVVTTISAGLRSFDNHRPYTRRRRVLLFLAVSTACSSAIRTGQTKAGTAAQRLRGRDAHAYCFGMPWREGRHSWEAKLRAAANRAGPIQCDEFPA